MEYYKLVWCIVLCALFAHINEARMLDEMTSSNSSSVTYDYGDAIGKAILFFEGQRSGKLPSSQRMNWRGDSALSDGKLENVT